ncbi:type II toxin-antitoxin system RelE/ParE family toxin [Candidatus Woesearchaeota archaeon]|nr:type II toxin-antitoxin system RelE/ParE family toxin [Candidatus Woesearchaeota archaeon]
MITFPAEFSSKAAKYIKKLDGVTKKRIEERINKLEENPFPQEVERVESFGGEKVFRVRVGDQRILYVVRYNPHKLIIAKVDNRSRVYD